MTDPYAILGLHSHATPAQVRLAFRRMALRHHPDRNPGDLGAAERFKRVVAAYRAILGHPAPVQAAPVEPVGPPPGRFACMSCGDQFAIEGACFRCHVPLTDRRQGAQTVVEDPRVQLWIEALETRRPIVVPEWATGVPMGVVVVLLFLLAAIGTWTVGPIGPSFLFAGFALYLIAGEAHRRAAMALANR